MPLADESVDLTSGNLWAHIWQLSWPMLLIMVFNFFVGLTDVYVAGLINPEVQAAVGFVSQIYFFIIIIANAISIGTLALITRAIGSKQLRKAVKIARQSLISSILAALGLMSFVLVFTREIVSAAGFPVEIQTIAEVFLRFFALAIASNYVLITANAVFRASGEVKKVLLVMSFVSALNIAGDFILVFGVYPFPALGYKGIAISTASSLTIGMLMSLVLFWITRWRGIYALPIGISFSTIRKIASISWPSVLMQLGWNAGSIVLYNILGRLGTASITALAAITNGLRMEAIVYLPAFALNMAASILVGQNLGAGNPSRAEKAGWNIALGGIVLVSIMALAIFIWANEVASFLTNDPAVLEETVSYLRINMLSEPFMALSVVLGGSLQGAGDTRGTMWIIIISNWIIRLPLAYAFAHILNLGATGVWVAMVISMSFQGILMGLRFHRGKWKELQLE